MKNVGMAGAVALVGIGLITIGLGREPSNAHPPNNRHTLTLATLTPQPSPSRRTGHEGKDCEIEVFEQALRFYATGCESAAGDDLFRWEADNARVDLLGTGFDQTVRGGVCNVANCLAEAIIALPIQIATPHGIRIIPLDLCPGGPLEFETVLGFIPSCVKIAGYVDIDEDGRPDVMIRATDGTRFALGWLRNIYDGPARLPADLNDDGRVDGADLGELFVQWTG